MSSCSFIELAPDVIIGRAEKVIEWYLADREKVKKSVIDRERGGFWSRFFGVDKLSDAEIAKRLATPGNTYSWSWAFACEHNDAEIATCEKMMALGRVAKETGVSHVHISADDWNILVRT